jgi:hypothetical protein
MSSPESRFAKDVATQLDRRRMRRRMLALIVLVAAIVLAVLYLTCGRGRGLGGRGTDKGKGPGAGAAVDRGPRRCVIRVTAAGIAVDGKPTTRDAAVTACKATTGADVVVTGDARQGDWDELRAALEAANIAIYKR